MKRNYFILFLCLVFGVLGFTRSASAVQCRNAPSNQCQASGDTPPGGCYADTINPEFNPDAYVTCSCPANQKAQCTSGGGLCRDGLGNLNSCGPIGCQCFIDNSGAGTCITPGDPCEGDALCCPLGHHTYSCNAGNQCIQNDSCNSGIQTCYTDDSNCNSDCVVPVGLTMDVTPSYESVPTGSTYSFTVTLVATGLTGPQSYTLDVLGGPIGGSLNNNTITLTQASPSGSRTFSGTGNNPSTYLLTFEAQYTGTNAMAAQKPATLVVTAAPTNGVCGPAAMPYTNGSSSFSGALCNSGSTVDQTTLIPFTPSFPAAGATTSWKCSGSNGGLPSAVCTASQNPSTGACTTVNDPICNDGNSCTTDTCTNPGQPNSTCTHTASGTHFYCGAGNTCQSAANTSSVCGNIDSCTSAGPACGTNIDYCGSANHQSFTSAPAGNLCAAGSNLSSSQPSGSGPWNWTCTGPTNSSNCNATQSGSPPTVSGTITASPNPLNYGASTVIHWTLLNSTNAVITSSPNDNNFNNRGVIDTNGSQDNSSNLIQNTTYTLHNQGPSGPVIANVTVNVNATGPTCGSANGQTFGAASDFDSINDLCSDGSMPSVITQLDGHWTWQCSATITCSATPASFGCGPAADHYTADASDGTWHVAGPFAGQSDNFCGSSLRYVEEGFVSFPGYGDTVSWHCADYLGNANETTCYASRDAAPACTPWTYNPTFSGFSLSSATAPTKPLNISTTDTYFYGFVDYGTRANPSIIQPPQNGSYPPGVNGCVDTGVWYGANSRVFKCKTPAAGSYSLGTGIKANSENVCTVSNQVIGNLTVTAPPPPTVTVTPPGNPPTGDNHQTNATVACGNIKLSWVDMSDNEDGFRVYTNSSPATSTATVIQTVTSTSKASTGQGYNFTYNLGTNTIPYYYWVTAYNAAASSQSAYATFGLLANSVCAPGITDSGKDIIGVNGGTISPAPNACNGGTDALPANVTLIASDKLKFQISMCNDTGSAKVTNIHVADTMINLQKPAGGWNAQFCSGVNFSTCVAIPAGNITDGSSGLNSNISFDLSSSVYDIDEGASSAIIYEAQLPDKGNFSGSSSRFQNSWNMTYGSNLKFKQNTPLLPFYTGKTPPTIIEVP